MEDAGNTFLLLGLVEVEDGMISKDWLLVGKEPIETEELDSESWRTWIELQVVEGGI